VVVGGSNLEPTATCGMHAGAGTREPEERHRRSNDPNPQRGVEDAVLGIGRDVAESLAFIRSECSDKAKTQHVVQFVAASVMIAPP
jgi:hypothetical protein